MDEISYLSIDSELLDVMITWDQTGSYEVAELQTQLEGTGGDDWMTTLLQTKAFHRIPPANIQAIFMRLQRVPFRAGDVVIKQGDEGDYFYVIVSGKCIVTRETPLNREGIKLAELGVGDTFGEEALIAEAKRNATVTMMHRRRADAPQQAGLPRAHERAAAAVGELRAGERDHSARRTLARRAAAQRAPEPRHRGIAQHPAVLHPSEAVGARSQHVPYVVYCDTGRRSSAAAFILVERGFDAYVLTGGLTNSDSRRCAARRSQLLYIVCVALSPESAPAR